MLFPIIVKILWVIIFRLRNEKKDILKRANYASKILTTTGAAYLGSQQILSE